MRVVLDEPSSLTVAYIMQPKNEVFLCDIRLYTQLCLYMYMQVSLQYT